MPAVTSKVPKREDTGLGSYELVVIIRPDASDEELEAAIEVTSRFITSHEGVIGEVEQWGKKRLAYPIRHHRDGSYVQTRFQLSPEHNHDLETSLRISEDVIRHLLIRLD
jgi:small subunit ribosomal protein S6